MSQRALTWMGTWRLKYNGWLVHSLSRTMFWGDKFKQRFSPLGFSLLAAIIVTLMFGANTRKTMIYQLFSVFVALLVVAILAAWIQSLRQKRVYHVSRHLPKFATVDVSFSYQIEIQNQSGMDVDNLKVTERRRHYRPSLAQFMTMKEPYEDKRNAYDRQVGFYRFAWLQRWLSGCVIEPAVISRIKAKDSYVLNMKFKPLRRGYVYLSTLRLSQTEPLGLMYSFLDFEKQQSLLVLPKRYLIPPFIQVLGRSDREQEGLALVSDIGEPEEFHHMREYRAGDSPRHIHWPSMAGVGKPLVKVFQDEHFARQALILDNFVASEKHAWFTQAFEDGVSLAAGFALGVDNHDVVLDVMFVGENKQAIDMKAGRALAHAEQVLEALASLQLSEDEGGFDGLSNTVLAQAQRLGSCVIILLQWDEKRQALIRQLLAQSVAVRVFLIVDEASPNDVEDIALPTDMESCSVLKVGQIQQDLDVLDTGGR